MPSKPTEQSSAAPANPPDPPQGHTEADATSGASSRSRRKGGWRSLVERHHRPKPLVGAGRWLRLIGPGVITGAADDDPSGIGTYSQAGASFGLGQLWLALYMLPMLIAVQEMCARIGLVTDSGIAAVVRKSYSRWLLFSVVALVVIANTLNIGADLGAMAATVQLFLPDTPFLLLVFLLALGILTLEVFVSYKRYAVILKILSLFLLSYIATGLIVGGNGLTLLRATIIPSIQLTPAFLALIVGVLGTTISPYLFFWQASEEVEELKETSGNQPEKPPTGRRLRHHLRDLRIDTALGMFFSEIATWFILFTTGSVLYTHGVRTITTADQAAAALEPLVHSFPQAGLLAKSIFALGIFGVGLLGVPVLAGSSGYAVAEAFHWSEGLGKTAKQARGFYAVIALATAVGMLIDFLHINPIQALVFSAIINGVVAVPLLVVLLLIANNKKIMGAHTNGRLSNIVGGVTTLAMVAAAIGMFITLFIP